MTTMNERVKMIRKSDKLNGSEKMTLERFGERLGVTKMTISRIENGVNSVTDQMFKSICREFNVNPDWLRDGSGSMFIERSRNDQIATFIDDILKNDPDGFRAHLISALSELNASDWERIAQVAERLVADQEKEKAAAERQRLHEELDRQLDAEEDQAERSGVSSVS